MEMIEQELMRLRTRIDELRTRVVPDLENRTQGLFAQIMPMKAGSEDREKLEAEYTLLEKELRLRSDEIIRLNQEIDNLETQKSARR